MITPELIARIKQEIESGLSRTEAASAMRIAGLTEEDVANVFADIGPAEPSPVDAITPVPKAPLTAPPSPKPPPAEIVTKMPAVPAQATQTAPSATEVDLIAPSINPSAIKAPLAPKPIPTPALALAATVKMPPPPPPQTLAQMNASQPAVVKSPERSHHLVLIIGIFFAIVIIIALGGLGVYEYLQNQALSEQPYSTPTPISHLPATVAVATTTIPTAVSASSSPTALSVSLATTSPVSTTTKIIATSTKMLECSSVKIALPEKWNALPIPSPQEQSPALDADGCYKSTAGCLCQRKAPPGPSANLVFSVAVTPYTASGKLADIMQALSHGRPENVKNMTFSGVPAMQFTTAAGNESTGNLIFLKNQKLYAFAFDADVSTFKDFWPNILTALQGAQIK